MNMEDSKDADHEWLAYLNRESRLKVLIKDAHLGEMGGIGKSIGSETPTH